MHSKALGRTQEHSRFAPSTLRNAFCIAINRNQHSRLLHQLFAECLLRVEPEALSRLGTTGAARPLVGGGLGDGGDEERLDPDARIVHLMREVIRCTQMALRSHSDGTQMEMRWHSDGTQMALGCTQMLQSCAHLLLGEARVDDIHDPIDREGGLRDVRREDNLTAGRAAGLSGRRRRIEDGALAIHG